MNDTIHDIAWGNKIDKMKKLLKKGIDINERDDEFGNSPLNTAIAKRHEEMALLLLENGADGSIQDNNGNNALHYAVEHNMTDIAKYILNKFPETLNVENVDKATVLWKTVMNPKASLSFIEYLLQQGADKTSTISLVEAFNEEELTKLFERY